MSSLSQNACVNMARPSGSSNGSHSNYHSQNYCREFTPNRDIPGRGAQAVYEHDESYDLHFTNSQAKSHSNEEQSRISSMQTVKLQGFQKLVGTEIQDRKTLPFQSD